MRTTILFLALISALAAAQTAPPSKKVLTPDQIAYQAALKTYNVHADQLRAHAKFAFAAETTREKAPICPDAGSTIEINNCLVRENNLTTANLKAFITALRALLALPAPPIPGMTSPLSGPSGLEATPATDTAALDASESAFRAYAKAECDAVDVHWRGGTIVNAMDGQCDLRQSRSRLHELVEVYGEALDLH